ncbi:MAG: 30S ribosomal protein S20 [Planctomycetota bacterium]|nr:30S ribosomal protein S20 [Planctomycetota bacterium]
MPILKRRSAMKRVRQNKRRRLRNRMNRSALRTAMRRFAEAVKAGPEQAKVALPDAFRALDVAARKGAIPKKRADRKKARLALMAARAAGPASGQAGTPASAEPPAGTGGAVGQAQPQAPAQP